MELASEQLLGDEFFMENGIIREANEYRNRKEDTIGELIFNTLSETPECIGHIDASTGKSKTFAKIKEESVLLATWMRKEGIGLQDVVSVCTPRHNDKEIPFYATTFVGATYFPFPGQFDLTSCRRFINALTPRLIFASKDKINILEEAAALENHKWKIVVVDKDSNYVTLKDILETPPSEDIKFFAVSKVNPDDACIITPTSGTTGPPKLPSMGYKNVMLRSLSFDIFPKSNGSSQIALSYMSLQSGIQSLFSVRCLLNRWAQVFHKGIDSDDTCKIIEKYKINVLLLDVYEILLLKESSTIKKYDLKSVTFIHSIGSKLFEEVRRQVLDIFPNVDYISRGFGMNETGLVTLFTKKCRNPQSEGIVIPNVQVKIIDRTTGLKLVHNQVGELCIKSPCMMTGYHKNPTANKLVFDDEGWFHSGDEAYCDENGEIVVVGRLKEMIKYRGTNLYPSYVEQSLLSHPDIIDAAVVGIDHDLHVEQPVAYVKVTQGSCITEEDVLKLMPELPFRDTFDNRIIFTDDIPRASLGKINRRILMERAEKFYKSKP